MAGRRKKPANDSVLHRAELPQPGPRPKRSDPEYYEKLRANAIAAFKRDQANAKAAGFTYYIWRTCKDSRVCPICAQKEGKRFRWDTEPEQGHPGFGCEGEGCYCRCFAQVDVRS
ncbi:phage minor head protein [Metapseudomonas otitidis]|uniref:phage minor head protein n=1 Tax=Metapseudomonas otitidis TaxID=319939 RepID=UPI0037420528